MSIYDCGICPMCTILDQIVPFEFALDEPCTVDMYQDMRGCAD